LPSEAIVAAIEPVNLAGSLALTDAMYSRVWCPGENSRVLILRVVKRGGRWRVISSLNEEQLWKV
jgi:hypothetical protein